MFGPEWAEGCPACSFWADSFDRAIVHLNHRDVTMLCASRASLAKLEAYKRKQQKSCCHPAEPDSFPQDAPVMIIRRKAETVRAV